jgi:hypothetical protein
MLQGNHYCSREGTDGGSGYHYSNTYVSNICVLFIHLIWFSDGSYYYQNTDGSTYYNSGSGYAQYTPDQTSKK